MNGVVDNCDFAEVGDGSMLEAKTNALHQMVAASRRGLLGAGYGALVAGKESALMTKLIHNPYSQDIYADAAVGFFTYNGNMRITLESVRSDYTQEPISTDRVVVGRLVMPVAAAEALAKGILDQLERLKSSPAGLPPATMQ